MPEDDPTRAQIAGRFVQLAGWPERSAELNSRRLRMQPPGQRAGVFKCRFDGEGRAVKQRRRERDAVHPAHDQIAGRTPDPTLEQQGGDRNPRREQFARPCLAPRGAAASLMILRTAASGPTLIR